MNATDNTASTAIKEVHNLIIVDRSGSMWNIAPQAIAGVNETLGTIRAAQQSTGIMQYVTIISFCGCCTKVFCKNSPVKDVPHMTARDYEPCCNTPLYDAMGESIITLREYLQSRSDYAVSVTIITDGYENSSKKWNASSIKALVELLKADGWLFAYIGANQDVEKVSHDISIDNSMSFQATPEATEDMFMKERSARMRWSQKLTRPMASKLRNIDYFDKTDDTDLSDDE